MNTECIEVFCVQSAKEALNVFVKNECCLVIISLHPSANQDMEVLRVMRELKSIPIIALVSKLTIYEKITLFHNGVNVCLEKPINLDLCTAQAHSLIELYLNAKEMGWDSYPLIFGKDLIINPIYHHVIIDGESLELTRTEFDLLFYMASHPNQIFTRQQLYCQIWGDDLGINGENTVRSHIGNLYKKLSDAGKNYIQNTRGVGYKFVPPADNE